MSEEVSLLNGFTMFVERTVAATLTNVLLICLKGVDVISTLISFKIDVEKVKTTFSCVLESVFSFNVAYERMGLPRDVDSVLNNIFVCPEPCAVLNNVGKCRVVDDDNCTSDLVVKHSSLL